MRAALLLLVFTACKADPNAEVCEHYAKLMTDCREDKSDDSGLVRDTATTCGAYNACRAP